MAVHNNVIIGDDRKNGSVSFPNQRVSRKKKLTKTWQRDSLDYLISQINTSNTNRKTSSEISANWDFYNSHLSESNIKKTLDPLGVENDLADGDGNLAFEFYNILDQPFDTLLGEELKRQSDVKAYAINANVVNEKDREFKDTVNNYLQGIAEANQDLDERALQDKLKEYDKFRKNDLQSAHEKMANQMIQFIKNDTNLNTKVSFNKGFKSLEIVGESIYRVGHAGKELTFESVNTKNFTVLGMGYSPYIADGEAWIEEDRVSPSKIIEEFAEELTDTEIDDIFSKGDKDDGNLNPDKIALIDVNSDGRMDKKPLPLVDDGEFILLDGSDDSETDINGNIRVYRVQWLTLRKLGKLKYYDEFGDAQYEWVDEDYVIDESAGEEISWVWVNELWEGTRIGNDIYKKVRPCPVQMRSQVNPAIVKPSYIGYVLSNNGVAQESRLDKLKPYQNMYNVWANKLIKLWTEHIGKAVVVDVAKIPDGMDTDEWYLWLKRFNISFENSFAEGKKGAAKGMIAGNMQQSSKVLDLGLAEEINQAILTLSWIEQQVNKISAVPEARQGATSGREGLGVTQQSIVSSSNQTEFDYMIHDLMKSKSYEIMLEYLKILWKDEKGKRQYYLDDLSNYILDVDGALLNEAEYAIRITNSSQLYSMYTAIQQLAHAAMQTGRATLTDIAKMYMATSPSEMIHDLEEAEERRAEEQNAQAKMAQETAQQQSEMQSQLSQMEHAQELEKIDKEFGYKMQIEAIKVQAQLDTHSTDNNQNNIEDQVELDKMKIKADSDKELLDKKLAHDEKIKSQELESKEKIANINLKKSNNSK